MTPRPDPPPRRPARPVDDLGAGLCGLSTQTPDHQRETVERLHLSYPMLGDPVSG